MLETFFKYLMFFSSLLLFEWGTENWWEALCTWFALSAFGLYWGLWMGTQLFTPLLVLMGYFYWVGALTQRILFLPLGVGQGWILSLGCTRLGKRTGKETGSRPSFDRRSLNLLYLVWHLIVLAMPCVSECGVSLVHFPQRVNLLLRCSG